MNTFRTAALMAAMMILFVLIGGAVGGQGGMAIAFVLALGMNFLSYWFSDKMVLKMYGAEEVSREEAPELYNMVDRLRQRAELPMPKVCVVPDDTPNAFATGRNPDNAVVAVTRGLMRNLNREEIEGVIAHELAHIKNRDMLVSSIAATMAAAITYLAYAALLFGNRNQNPIVGILTFFLAPMAASLIQMAISRTREYGADQEGARIAGNPRGLASALASLQAAVQQRPASAKDPKTEATSHMFIVNPFSGDVSSKLSSLFSTHPPMEDRIARLNEMAQTGDY